MGGQVRSIKQNIPFALRRRPQGTGGQITSNSHFYLRNTGLELCELLGTVCCCCCGGEQFAGSSHLLQYTVLQLHKLSSRWDPGSSTLIQFPFAGLRLYEFTSGWDPAKVSFQFFFLCALSTQMDSPCLFHRSLNKICSCFYKPRDHQPWSYPKL